LLASTLSLQKPQRIMALLMGMSVCLLVDAALESRICTTLREHEATFPHQHGHPMQHPTARWGFPYFLGMHLLLMPGEWPFVRNLTDTHEHLPQLLGQPYTAF
jgi:hypothetical protein